MYWHFSSFTVHIAVLLAFMLLLSLESIEFDSLAYVAVTGAICATLKMHGLRNCITNAVNQGAIQFQWFPIYLQVNSIACDSHFMQFCCWFGWITIVGGVKFIILPLPPSLSRAPFLSLLFTICFLSTHSPVCTFSVQIEEAAHSYFLSMKPIQPRHHTGTRHIFTWFM